MFTMFESLDAFRAFADTPAGLAFAIFTTLLICVAMFPFLTKTTTVVIQGPEFPLVSPVEFPKQVFDLHVPPRPSVTPEILFEAARNLVEDIYDPEEDMDAFAHDIVDVYEDPTSGFELALLLKDRHGWHITDTIVETLSCMDSEVRNLLRLEIGKWVKAYHIQPPLPLGSPVRYRSGFEVKVGVLDEICDHSPGSYCIIPGDRSESQEKQKLRHVVAYEDVELLDEAPAA